MVFAISLALKQMVGATLKWPILVFGSTSLSIFLPRQKFSWCATLMKLATLNDLSHDQYESPFFFRNDKVLRYSNF